MSARWSLERGARVLERGGTRFSVWAPRAERAAVVIEGGGEHVMEARGGGVFEVEVADAGPGTEYRYRLNGNAPLPDPVSRHQPHGAHGASRVVDPNAFTWTDDAWSGIEMADLVIYELHVGTFSAEGTFEGVIPHLARLRSLGVTAIELMPVAEFPGGRNWGYDGAHSYAPQSTYGGPEGLRRLVDAAHAEGLAVLLDVVYNHLGPEGSYLGSYGVYFTDAYRTPWGSALNYDGADSGEVRRYFVDNALYWLTEFHLDGLRLDAVQAIVDLGATHVLAELSEAVARQGRLLGRRMVLIGESDLNDPKAVRARELYGWGLDGQWADDLHHAVHALLTGERTGYYADFGTVGDVARALRTPFVNDGRYSAYRRRKHGAPADGIARDRFVVYAQNHDQVGNRARGDRMASFLAPPLQRVAAALYLLSPYVPMLFMGEEYGETAPFQYFVSHGDPRLVEAVRQGRKREFASFAWGEELADPQSPGTFERSRLSHERRDAGPHVTTYALYAALLRLRRDEPALRPGSADARVAWDEAGWVSLELLTTGGGRDLLVLYNLSGRPREVPAAGTRAGSWRLVLHTDDRTFGGEGREPSPRIAPDAAGAAGVALGPWTAAAYALDPTAPAPA